MSKLSKYSSILKLSSYVFQFKGTFAATLFCGVMKNITTLISLLLGAFLAGKAFSGAPAGEIRRFLGLLIALVVLKGVFVYLHMLITHQLAYNVLRRLREDIYDVVEKSSPLSSLRYHSGNLSSIVMEDVELLEGFYAHLMGDYLIAMISVLLFFGIFAYFSLTAAVLSLIFAAVIAFFPYSFSKRKAALGKKMREARGRNNSFVLDAIQGLKEILIFNREKEYIKKVMDDTMAMNQLELKDGLIRGVQNMFSNLAMSLFFIFVIVLAHSKVIAGSLSGEYLSVYIVMALNVFIPILSVSGTAEGLNLIAASADRIYTLLHEKSPLSPDMPFSAAAPDETEAVFSFRNVSFSYDKGRPVLKNVSFQIARGENIAIVGASGAGKSTLVSLMMRFYDVEEGDIYLGRKNIRSLEPEDVRAQIAFVPQSSVLFRGSLLDNLRLGRPEAERSEVKEAAEIAAAAEFIEKLPEQYKTKIGEGGQQFSGGERQRLAIARALVYGAPILIMDEAVSNLDSESERKFRIALRRIKEDKTLITIAHRYSTIAESDRVIEIEDGAIAYDGPTKPWLSEHVSLSRSRQQKVDWIQRG